MYYQRETPRMSIEINTMNREIIITQKWHYQWIEGDIPISPWNPKEQEVFHKNCEYQIWMIWSKRFKLKLINTKDNPKHKIQKSDIYTVIFNITYHHSPRIDWHWLVKVKKAFKLEGELRSNVDWVNREISLLSVEIEDERSKNIYGSFQTFIIPHEFGHAMGDLDDEYGKVYGNTKNPVFVLDFNSIMNIGHELRWRHINYIVSELDKMIPDGKFIYNRIGPIVNFN